MVLLRVKEASLYGSVKSLAFLLFEKLIVSIGLAPERSNTIPGATWKLVLSGDIVPATEFGGVSGLIALPLISLIRVGLVGG